MFRPPGSPAGGRAEAARGPAVCRTTVSEGGLVPRAPHLRPEVVGVRPPARHAGALVSERESAGSDWPYSRYAVAEMHYMMIRWGTATTQADCPA